MNDRIVTRDRLECVLDRDRRVEDDLREDGERRGFGVNLVGGTGL